MNAVERLRRDHRILRTKLDVLEAALAMGPQTWFVVREICCTLARQLRDHIKREEALVVACRSAMTPRVLAGVAVEHRDEPRHLAAINRLFTQGGREGMERMRPLLTQIIHGLRRHMDEEEAHLFPLFEQTFAGQAPAAVEAHPPQRLDETMTVNRVVHEYPPTRRIFERFFISLPLEGSNCLDEVAWRHGITSETLLQSLEAAVEEPRACAQAG